ncbi:MAG: MBL fold metallo-hydrolase [Oscillospiraceae bacterium]|nr:MBL fold metallo-hydrolase [Oscillospiraceae bacterium]
MELCSIASGSSGNCIYAGSDHCHILLDVGISGKRIEAGLQEIGLNVSELDGILITHEHTDHIKGLGVLARKFGLPMYATRGTIEEIYRTASLGDIDRSLFCEVLPESPFVIGDMTVLPISTSHDAADPVAYIMRSGKKSMAVITDLGIYDAHTVEMLQGLDVLLLEANHDVNMLLVGRYPYFLKQRILGEKGHLSNELSGQLLGQVLHDGFQRVILGHLSAENNYPELACESVRMEISMGDNPYRGSDFPIEVAARDVQSELITF